MSDTTAVQNPFNNQVVRNDSVQAAAEATRAMSEVQAAVVLAKKYPRDQQVAVDRILMACQRHTLAEAAVYSFPKGGQNVSGASIRLAEAMAREWGNISYGIVEQERRGDESTMLAYAWDLETNTQARAEYKVKHYRDARGDKKLLTDERDIYETVANQGARRLRACILKLIPGDVTEAAIKQAEETIKARVKDIPTAINRMLEAFKKHGVTKEMLEQRLRHRMDATNAAEIVALGRIYTSIEDGYASVQDYFEQAEPEAEKPVTRAEKARNAAAAAAGKKPPTEPQKTQREAPVEPTGEEIPDALFEGDER